MNVVIATPFYPPEAGVLGTYAAGLAGAFEKRGDSVTVVSFGDTRRLLPGIRHLAYFARLLAMPAGETGVGSRRKAGGAWRRGGVAQNRSGDLCVTGTFILALDTWSVGIPALLAAKIRRIPLVVRVGGDFLWETHVERIKEPVRLSEFYTRHRSYSLKERAIFHATRWFLRNADAVLFTTNFQKKIWEDAYGFPNAKSRIVENLYPAVRYAEPKGKVFVSAGRGIFLKNYELLERAFARVRTKYPATSLDTRMLPHEEHEARLAGAYATIIPSVSEVSSNMAIDAVTHGKPFIMTEDTGTKERLGGCGIFVDTRSEDALAAAIEQLLETEEYARLARVCRDFTFVHSWDEIAQEIIQAL